MKKAKEIPSSIKRIIFIVLVILFFFGAGVLAGNSGNIANVKIAFSNNHEMNVLTTKATVGEVLRENHIEVLEDEFVIPGFGTQITDNTTIKVLKKSQLNTLADFGFKGENISEEELLKAYSTITEKIVVEKVEIPYETITKDISNGHSTTTEKIIQSGRNGIKEVTYKIKYQNNIEIERQEISSKIISEPRNKIVQIQVKQIVTSRNEERTSAYVQPVGGLSEKVKGITPQIKTLNTSAYCACVSCCGKSNGTTASGAKATPWYTVAAGKGYPMGTIIYVPSLSYAPNGGWFVVQDRGGAISNNKMDVFMTSHSEALKFGRKNLECYIYVF